MAWKKNLEKFQGSKKVFIPKMKSASHETSFELIKKFKISAIQNKVPTGERLGALAAFDSRPMPIVQVP